MKRLPDLIDAIKVHCYSSARIKDEMKCLFDELSSELSVSCIISPPASHQTWRHCSIFPSLDLNSHLSFIHSNGKAKDERSNVKKTIAESLSIANEQWRFVRECPRVSNRIVPTDMQLLVNNDYEHALVLSHRGNRSELFVGWNYRCLLSRSSRWWMWLSMVNRTNERTNERTEKKPSVQYSIETESEREKREEIWSSFLLLSSPSNRI